MLYTDDLGMMFDPRRSSPCYRGHSSPNAVAAEVTRRSGKAAEDSRTPRPRRMSAISRDSAAAAEECGCPPPVSSLALLLVLELEFSQPRPTVNSLALEPQNSPRCKLSPLFAADLLPDLFTANLSRR